MVDALEAWLGLRTWPATEEGRGMYVAELRINKFRHIQDAQIGPLPRIAEESEVVVLAGPNGGGKSSILELLSYHFSNTWGYQWTLKRTFGNSSFEVRIGLSEADLQLISNAVSRDPALDSSGLLPELRSRRSYYVAWNYAGGEYEKDRDLNDKCATLARATLFDGMKTLFLRSDRYYDTKTYPRNTILDWQRRTLPGYMRSISLALTDQQYTDQIEFLIEQAYNFPRTLGLYYRDRDAGKAVGPKPEHPLRPYDELFQRLYPQYQLSDASEQLRDRLYITLPTGEELPFTDLSSGEQEVFFVLSFFLRNDIQNSIILVDEPELHLHPELARQMIKIMLSIKPGNQIWLATHNAELVDEAGRDRTYFVTRHSATEPATVRRASDEEGHVELLRTMFGYSGYVGLARKLVFLEGDEASADRRVFTSLFPDVAEQIRFIPLASAENVQRVHRGVMALLGESLGHSEFFLIRDRDYLPQSMSSKYEVDESGRIFLLKRHEIENYLLDADTISEVVEELLGTAISAGDVEKLLKRTAVGLSGKVLRDLAGVRLNGLFQLEDCSIGNFETGKVWLDDSLAWDTSVTDAARKRCVERVTSVTKAIGDRTDPGAVEGVFDAAKSEVRDALIGQAWKTLFPGKELLEGLVTALGLPKGPVLINSVIRRMAAHPARIDTELTAIVERIVCPQQTA